MISAAVAAALLFRLALAAWAANVPAGLAELGPPVPRGGYFAATGGRAVDPAWSGLGGGAYLGIVLPPDMKHQRQGRGTWGTP